MPGFFNHGLPKLETLPLHLETSEHSLDFRRPRRRDLRGLPPLTDELTYFTLDQTKEMSWPQMYRFLKDPLGMTWGIFNSEGRHIGATGLRYGAQDILDVYILIAKEHQNRRVGTAALLAPLWYSFAYQQERILATRVSQGNTRSRKLLEGAGFVYDAVGTGKSKLVDGQQQAWLRMSAYNPDVGDGRNRWNERMAATMGLARSAVHLATK